MYLPNISYFTLNDNTSDWAIQFHKMLEQKLLITSVLRKYTNTEHACVYLLGAKMRKPNGAHCTQQLANKLHQPFALHYTIDKFRSTQVCCVRNKFAISPQSILIRLYGVISTIRSASQNTEHETAGHHVRVWRVVCECLWIYFRSSLLLSWISIQHDRRLAACSRSPKKSCSRHANQNIKHVDHRPKSSMSFMLYSGWR